MKRAIFLSILLSLLLLPATVFSQERTDIIKSGLTIRTNKIQEIVIEKKKKEKKILQPVKPGFQQSVTFGYYSEFDEYNHLQLDYIGGYRVNNNLFVGLGLGMDFAIDPRVQSIRTAYSSNYDYEEHFQFYDSGFAMPLFAHLRGYLGKKRFQPFAALSAGAVIRMPTKEEVNINDGSGGYLCTAEFGTSALFFEPMLGVDIRLSSKVSLNTQIGLKVQGIPAFEFVDATHADINNKSLGHFSIKLGCTF